MAERPRHREVPPTSPEEHEDDEDTGGAPDSGRRGKREKKAPKEPPAARAERERQEAIAALLAELRGPDMLRSGDRPLPATTPRHREQKPEKGFGGWVERRKAFGRETRDRYVGWRNDAAFNLQEKTFYVPNPLKPREALEKMAVNVAKAFYLGAKLLEEGMMVVERWFTTSFSWLPGGGDVERVIKEPLTDTRTPKDLEKK